MSRANPTTSNRRVLTVVRWPVGGIRTHLLYTYPLLAAAGYRFTLVGPANDAFRNLAGELQLGHDVETVEAPVEGADCRLRKTVRRLLTQRRFGLIHSHGLTSGVQAVLANLGHGVPHIITSHDVIRPNQFEGLRGWLKLKTLSYILGRANTLVTVSDDARNNHLSYLAAFRRNAHKVVTIFNGIDTSPFDHEDRSAQSSLRAELGIPEDTYLMAFLGRFMEQKGFLVLLDAIEQVVKHSVAMPEVAISGAALQEAARDGRVGGSFVGADSADGASCPLQLLAVGSGDYVREYRAEVARRADLRDRVRFLEYTPRIGPILRAIDLLVMPSLWEACPLLPMEAMCAAVPVLGSDCIGLREVLAGSPSVMVRTGDATALAQGIRQAMEKPWSARAREYAPVARRRFDVHACALELKSLFDRTMIV